MLEAEYQGCRYIVNAQTVNGHRQYTIVETNEKTGDFKEIPLDFKSYRELNGVKSEDLPMMMRQCFYCVLNGDIWEAPTPWFLQERQEKSIHRRSYGESRDRLCSVHGKHKQRKIAVFY